MSTYYIQQASFNDDVKMRWSNKLGWVDPHSDEHDTFSQHERDTVTLPIGGEWVSIPSLDEELPPRTKFPSERDLLQNCYTMLKDIHLGWPTNKLHMSPDLLLSEIEEICPWIDKGEGGK